MINLNVYAYAALIQLCIVLALLTGFLFYQVRQFKKRLTQKQGRVRELEQKPDVGQYFTTETKLTRGRHDAATALREGDLPPDDKSFLYALRADFLEIEQGLAENIERNDTFWKQVEDQLGTLLENHKLTPQQEKPAPPDLPVPTPGAPLEDSPDLHSILGSQVALIDKLKTQIGENIQNAETRAALETELNALAQSNREMTDCVSMLEDENGFLRTQIRALVDGP